MNVKRLFTLLPVFIGLLLASCATFQSPKVLEKGERSLTVGASALFGVGVTRPLFYDAYVPPPWFEIDTVFRTHVAKRVDAGLQLPCSIAESNSAIADVKYQILTQPFFLAASIGGGIRCVAGHNIDPIVQALVIGGADTFYVGLKPLFMPTLHFPLAGGVVVGLYGLGKKERLILEANVGFGDEAFVASFGPGWRFTF